MPRKAVIYCRVSTARQAEEGVSLDAQQQSCADYCDRQGWSIAEVFVERGASGRSRNGRPELARAIASAIHHKGVLVFWDLSRLARSVKDAIQVAESLKEAGANLAAVKDTIDTTTAMGQFFFVVMAAFAKLYSDTISENVKAANAYTVKQLGYRTQGKAPFGYHFNHTTGQREPDDEEQAIIAEVREAARGRSLAQAAEWLNRRKVQTPKGHRQGLKSLWHFEAVRRVLRRAEADNPLLVKARELPKKILEESA